MFRFRFRYLVAVGAMVGLFTSNANAIPAYARQMGVSCSYCHSENGYPRLTRFGRDFKASGYTMVGTEKTIGGGKSLEDKLVSIPSALNMSVVAGTSIDGTSGQGNSGRNVSTSNFGIFMGGRISENIGAFVEVGYAESSGPNSIDHFSLANLVTPITFKSGDNIFGIVPFSTDGHTATPSEFYDNGGQAAISRIGARDTFGAKGLSLYVYNENYFINYTAWSNDNHAGSNLKFANYIRFAYTPQVGPWDLEAGVQLMGGKTNATNGSIATKSTNAYCIDFNAMGKLAEKYPLDIAVSYAVAKYKSDSLFTTNSDKKDGKSFVFDTSLGVVPRVIVGHLKYAYDDHVVDSNSKVSTETLGLKYFIAENANIEVHYDIVGNNQPDTYGLNFEVAF